MKYLAHHGILGQKWGVRRFQNKDGSLTAKGKARQNKDQEKDNRGQEIFESIKSSANRVLDKADDDNFFNSDSMFSEKTMKKQAKIDAARNLINNLDYNKIKKGDFNSIIETGKSTAKSYLDDLDDVSFFNDDWDTRSAKQDRRDMIREFLD